MPPSAAPEWDRVGWIFESRATSAPASNASMAARMPAQPAPTMRTSCLASTTEEAIECAPSGDFATTVAKSGGHSGERPPPPFRRGRTRQPGPAGNSKAWGPPQRAGPTRSLHLVRENHALLHALVVDGHRDD